MHDASGRSAAEANAEATEYSRQYAEAQKVVLDYLKHIIALDTGSILLMATLLEKFFQRPQWKWMIAATFISLLLSALALTFSAFGVVRSIRTPLDVSGALKHFTSITFLLGVLGFVAGLTFLAVWAVRNWV